MTTPEPPTSPGRRLLDALDEIDGNRSVRLRLELLNHLLADTALTDRPDAAATAAAAVPFGVPGAARILSRLLAGTPPETRDGRARQWLARAAGTGDAAVATVVVAVAPHLDAADAADAALHELGTPQSWAAAMFALGRLDVTRVQGSAELRARIGALTEGFRPGRSTATGDDPWWRAVGVAGPDRAMADDALDHPERVAAVAALVAVEDGAWHLLAIRHHRVLAAVIADADRSGDAYLAAVRQRAGHDHLERHRELLSHLAPDERTSTAWNLVHTLVGLEAPPTAAAPPTSSGETSPTAQAPPRAASRPEPSAGVPATRRRGLGRFAQRMTRGLRRTPRSGHGVVNTGFASADEDTVLDGSRPLDPGRACVFWLEVAPEALQGSIEVEHVELPAQLPSRARLTVALFAYDGELELTSGATSGVLELTGDGTARVVQQPAGAASGRHPRRLRFPVTAPQTDGPARLRCSIYHRGVLIQSRVVTADVGGGVQRRGGRSRVLRSEVDYQLFRELEPEPLQALTEHRASLLLNHDGAGTHGLRFAAVDGDEVITRDVSIGEGVIADQIRMARHALRRVSWGSDEEWSEGRTYRYGQAPDEAQLTDDLVALAANGARFFQLLVEEVAATGPDGPRADPYLVRDRLAEVLRRPGRIQIALQQAPNHILPAALVYDHLFTDSAPADAYSLCGEFAEALRAGDRLEQAPCFVGDCPQAIPGADPTVVCPSGFWGFRHELGFPVTQGDESDATEIISVDGGPAIGVAVSTELVSHAGHVEGLRRLVDAHGRWRLADTRDEVLVGLSTDDQQVVYLYCHGGVADNVPYVRLGEDGARPITRLDLANARVRWATTRPLVVLNGCHTTALDPETAIDFVRFFVGTALASGVVGTEITVFEELGQVFGEALMARFLTSGTTLGAAIRGARLELLRTGNPLGLVYIPFALAGLRLDEVRPTPATVSS